MQYSAEMRWFPGEEIVSKSIEPWFTEQGKFFTGSSRRSDLYLLFKNMTTHGIKLREGKLEIKVLHHDWGELMINDHNKGRANMWCKYGFELKAVEDDVKEIIAAFAGLRSIGINRDWLRMDKERLLIKYAIDPAKGSLRIAGENEKPEQGCNVELTKFRVNLQKEQYSFGLEAFGRGVDVKKNLEIAVSTVFADGKIEGLRLDGSMSYPEFLSGIS